MSENLEAALQYQTADLPITLCSPGTKKPLAQDWSGKTYSVQELNDNFNRQPNLNVGLILGPRSQLIDVEYDDPTGEQALSELFNGYEPITPSYHSKRGRHHLFRWRDELAAIGKASVHWKGLEIRLGAGGRAAQSLLPPSETDSFIRYWRPGLDLRECTPAPVPPDVVRRLLSDRSEDSKGLQRARETETLKQSLGLSASPSLGLSVTTLEAVEDAINATLPSGVGFRNDRVFCLARHLKRIPELADAELDVLKPIVKEWYRRALPFIGTKDFLETWADFVYGWDRVRYAAGQEPIYAMFKKAIALPAPSIAEKYDSLPMRQLVQLCYFLQEQEGSGGVFRLDCRTAGSLIGVSHKQANKYLNLLKREKVLETVSVGTPGRASRYRFVADISA